ncbi:MAG: hypothetical protein ACOYJL_07590 [Tractidigestivibacter sp.]|jgi:hypothetical protein|uniref:hypothetical protein n=1 Tax=Tractidigestivibacter sp. TaxID=2847320 RepID=UPI003D94D1BA
MESFHGRALEDQFLSIARELGGDVQSRKDGDAYLAGTHALYHGGPVSWALTPKIFDEKQIKILSDAAETMGRIMDKVTAEYLRNPDFRAQFKFSPELEELTLIPTGYDQLIPIARVDVFFNEETGDYQFCELNTDGSAGMTTAVEVTRAIKRSQTYRRFAESHPVIQTFDPVESVVDAVIETYRSWANAKKLGSLDHPAVAIVDYSESVSADEVADILTHFAERGVPASFCDIRDLHIGKVGGRDALIGPNGPISCVYRRAVTSEIVARPCRGADALAEAARRGLACLIGGYRTWPCASKTVFAVLRSDAVRGVLTEDEIAFVNAHVPETVLLDENSDLAPYGDKDRWILKPAGGYNAEGVVAGLDCETNEQWQEALNECAKKGGIVQAYAPQYRTPTLVGGALADGADPLDAPEMSNMEGLYLFRGKFAGVFTRCGLQNVIGEWTHRVNMGCLVVKE